jgi:cell division protein FtsX
MTTMTDAVTVAIVAVIPPLLLSIIALMQAVRSQRTNAAAIQTVTDKTNTIEQKVDAVHEVTNNNFSVQRDEITLLRTEIDNLKATLDRYKQFS